MAKANPVLAAKLFPQKRKKIDSVRDSFDLHKNNNVLIDAYNAWVGLDDFRQKARRAKQYTFEDQWGDRIQTSCGWKTERRTILEQGNIPLSNNRIRGIVRSVIGQFQSNQTEPICISRKREIQNEAEIMSNTLQYVYQNNKLWELDAVNLNHLLVTGLSAFKSSYGYRNGIMDVWTDIVNHNRIFFDNHIEDPRHWDCHLIGELHDMGINDVMAKFSDGDPHKAERIKEIYGIFDKDYTISYWGNLTEDVNENIDFFINTNRDETRCRVIEIWRKEAKERYLIHDYLTGEYYKAETSEKKILDEENRTRIQQQAAAGVLPEDMKLIEYEWFIDNYWYCYYMSPYGDILKEMETPYWHESHPYSFKIFQFFDKKVYSFVEGFIDQQRYINRLIMLQDMIVRSSAKGVLAIAEDSMPKGWNIERYADEYKKINGVIVYTVKNGVANIPKQIIENSTKLGTSEMLSIELKLLEDISGVQGAMQGRAPSSGTPASLYAQQTQNSITSLVEIMEAYKCLREDRDFKNMQLIQQFYTEPRYINVNNGSSGKKIVYDPKLVRNAKFMISITESSSSPAYRMIGNEFLMQLFGTGQISIEQLLENGTFPFADKLLQSIKSKKDEIALNGNSEQPLVPQDIQSELNSNTNPLIQRILNNNEA